MISTEDGDLLSQFDDINESFIPLHERIAKLPPKIRDTPHQKMLINNHTDANKCKIKRYLNLEDIFACCKLFQKVTKNLDFHLMLKTKDLQDIVCTSMGNDINLTINKLYLFIPIHMPSVETQLMFIEATQKIYKLSYDECYTERQVLSDMIVPADIGSAQEVSSPEYLTFAHQTQIRTEVPNKNNKIAKFDNFDLREYFVEIDGQRYPRDSLLIKYEKNKYFGLYEDIKLFFKECVGEPISNLLISSYPEMKTKYLIGILDLRHQLDHIRPKTVQLF